MKHLKWLSAVRGFCLIPNAVSASEKATVAPKMSVAEIVSKNAAARGGLDAWRGVHTLELKGKMQAGGNDRSTVVLPEGNRGKEIVHPRPKEQAQLPFTLDLERGRKIRLELQFKGQAAVHVYDGTNGWKVRPFLNRHEVEQYTPEELKTASAQSDLDGWLMDHAAKGSTVELVGTVQVEGHDAYNLEVTDKDRNMRHVWVDAKSFLEVKIEGAPRRLDGKYHAVATYLRDYSSADGLVMQYLLETKVGGVKDTEKVTIDSIVSNLKIDEARFATPQSESVRQGR